MSRPTFMTLALGGYLLKPSLAIDSYVEEWHKNPRGQELHEYLGMEWGDYSAWVNDPDCLPLILRARRYNERLTSLLQQSEGSEFAIAARGVSHDEFAGLIKWLRANHLK